jgi:hypothetical protein
MTKPSSHDLEILKIPAYQRKTALDRRSAKKPLRTALDRKQDEDRKQEVRQDRLSKTARVSKVDLPRPTAATYSFRKNFQKEMQRAHEELSIQDASPVVLDAPLSPLPSTKVATHKPSSRYETVGEVTMYLEKIQVAIIDVTKPIRLGDALWFEDETGLFFQTVESMQLNRKEIKIARKGMDIGMKVLREPRLHGRVYKA